MSGLHQRFGLAVTCGVILCAACPVTLTPVEQLEFSCEDDEGCSAGYDCVAGRCWPSHLDAGLAADAIAMDSAAPDLDPGDLGVDAGPADVTQDQAAPDVVASDSTSADLATTDAAVADQVAVDTLVPDSAQSDSAVPDVAPTETPNPINLELTARYEEVWLNFAVPDYPGISCTVRSRSDGDYPTGHEDGNQVEIFNTVGSQFVVDSGLIADQPIHYAVFCSSALGWNDAVVPGANAGTVTPLPAWWTAGYSWLHRRRLVIDNSTRGPLVGFPVLVHLTTDRIDYNLCEAGGEDLRFVGAAGQLDYEIEEWNSSGSSYIWVKIPHLEAGSADGFIYMYYDNDGVASAQDPAAVWGNGYVAVYHLGADLSDSTGGDHDGLPGPSATLATTPGQIGQGRSFNGTSDYIELPDEQDFELTSGFTVSLWFKVNQFDEPNTVLIAKGSQAWQLNRDDNTPHLAFGTARADNQNLELLAGSTGVSGGDWFLATAVFDDANNSRWLYINSTADNDDNFNQALNASDDPVRIGDNAGDPGLLFDGVIDEVRVSSTARTADWITAQHASMSDALINYDAYQVENLNP